jgi:hypothetical protein
MSPEMVSLPLEHGAVVEAKDNKGKTTPDSLCDL